MARRYRSGPLNFPAHPVEDSDNATDNSGHDDVAFAVEGCAGWRYVAEELAAAGITAHLAEPADTAAPDHRIRAFTVLGIGGGR